MTRTLSDTNLSAAAILLSAFASTSAAMTPTNLRCEYVTNPLGVDAARPRLSWQLTSDQRDQVQTAYQVLVASQADLLDADRGDLWDSGKVASSEQIQIAYAGAPLRSGQRAYWKLRVWDRDDAASAYSETAWWEMGLLTPADWTGKWITPDKPLPTDEAELYDEHPAPLLRRAFTIDKEIRRARAYVSGLGYYELSLNGQRVGDYVLDPGWTAYRKRVLYSTYDVTEQLQRGPNVVGSMLGNGWYNPLPMRFWGKINIREHLTIGRPRLIVQLNIEYADGSSESIVTDEHWTTRDGPIRKNNIYLGEVYDARREQPGWDRPGFDDSDWAPVVEATEAVGPLRTQTIPPIRITRTVKPVRITEPKPGTFIVDMGQNFAGWIALRIQGEAGTAVHLRYGELLHPDGALNGLTSVAGQIKQPGMGGPGAPPTAWQADTHILKGDGVETYRPRFTFHGFRYVEIAGYPGTPTLDAIEGYLVNSDVADAGTFTCSNELFNRIQEIVRWTQLSNMFSVQSDCPHRERFSYGGDIIASGEMAMLNFDMAAFYVKTLQDHMDEIRPNGGPTETSPFVGIADHGFGEGSGPIGWSTMVPWLQWKLYKYYGDKQSLAEHYDATKRWVRLLETSAVDHIIGHGISDHESLVPKPEALTGTGFYYHNVCLLARIAEVLGRTDDVERYTALAGTICDAFNAKFHQADSGRYDSGTQACQAFALFFDLVPDDQRDAALDVLVRDVLDEHGGHLTTGIFGTKYMLLALSDLGRADVAYTIANQKTFPGWGHMLEGGATTLWEHWEYSDNVYSHNHPMFGSVSEWFFKALAGIQPAPTAVGFDRIVIRPQIVGELTWARGHYDSIRGRITSEWKREGDTLTLDVTIPPNTTAKVYVPASDPSAVQESGKPAKQAKGVQKLETTETTAIIELGSGHYRFTTRVGPNTKERP